MHFQQAHICVFMLVHLASPLGHSLPSALHVSSAQQYDLPLLMQSSHLLLPPLWPRRKLAADALLTKSIITVPISAPEAEGTRFQTRFTMADLTPDGQGLQAGGHQMFLEALSS